MNLPKTTVWPGFRRSCGALGEIYTAGAVSFRDSSLSLSGVGREFRAVVGDAHLTYDCR